MTSGLCITNVILNLIIFSPSAPAASNDLTISTPSELCTFLKENQPRHMTEKMKKREVKRYLHRDPSWNLQGKFQDTLLCFVPKPLPAIVCTKQKKCIFSPVWRREALLEGSEYPTPNLFLAYIQLNIRYYFI